MKTHHFKYILLLALILLGITSLLYSQDPPKQTNGEETTTEQGPPDEPNPIESLNKSIINRIRDLEDTQSIIQDKVDNPFQIILMIFGSIIILIIGVLFFLSKRQWRDRSQENDQRWDGQLKYIRQQGRENTEKLEGMMSNHTTLRNEQTKLQNTLSKVESRLDGLELKLENIDLDKAPDESSEEKRQDNEQPQLEKIIQETQTQVEALALAYESGEPIDMISVENPTPSQNVITILNSIAYDLSEWRSELEQDKTTDPELVRILINAERNIKDRLKRIRSESPISQIPLDVAIDVNTEVELTQIHNQCIAHVARLEGVFSAYELTYQVNVEEYNQFIPQFIRYRLFNEVADFVPFEDLPKKMDRFLRFLKYEVVPIEIGITKAASHVHEIRESRHTSGEPGTIVEVLLPGLRQIADGEIIQKPIVIRGE